MASTPSAGGALPVAPVVIPIGPLLRYALPSCSACRVVFQINGAIILQEPRADLLDPIDGRGVLSRFFRDLIVGDRIAAKAEE
jgi:hypothetical protein